MHEILFGPVNSRRLGRSLGVDLVPFKYCTYDCIYCQLGPTDHLSSKRRIFFPTRRVHEEAVRFFQQPGASESLDVVSLAGSGEPTLAANLGEVIRWIKDITPIPAAVLTNGSLMWMDEVQQDLLGADIVLPSIDAVTEKVFRKINHPHRDLSLEKILDGIHRFSRVFTGRLFPEVMIIEGINDFPEEIDRIVEFLEKLKPDRVHLNVADRVPNREKIKSPNPEKMEEIKSRFPAAMAVDVVGKAPDIFSYRDWENVEEKIISHLMRRPAVPGDLASGLGIPLDRIIDALKNLERQELIIEIPDRTDNYYYINRNT